MSAIETEGCRTRQQNITRYERLLATYLTDIERNFIELRLSEEQAALRYLDQRIGHDALARSGRTW